MIYLRLFPRAIYTSFVIEHVFHTVQSQFFSRICMLIAVVIVSGLYKQRRMLVREKWVPRELILRLIYVTIKLQFSFYSLVRSTANYKNNYKLSCTLIKFYQYSNGSSSHFHEGQRTFWPYLIAFETFILRLSRCELKLAAVSRFGSLGMQTRSGQTEESIKITWTVNSEQLVLTFGEARTTEITSSIQTPRLRWFDVDQGFVGGFILHAI